MPARVSNLVLTGATGALGRNTIATMRTRFPEALIQILARDPASVGERGGIVAIPADVTLTEFGNPEVRNVLRQATHIIHMAADVRWAQTREMAVARNAESTQRMLECLDGVGPNFRRFVYVSTAFAEAPGRCSTCEAAIHEDGRDFSNSYEYSKWLAESYVRECKVPWTIIRPSLIVGSTVDGAIGRYNGVYQLLDFMARGMLPFLIGDAGGFVDIVPVDRVANVIADCTTDPTAEGQTVLAVSGEKGATVAAIIQHCVKALNRFRAENGAPPVGPPAVISCDVYSRLYRPFFKAEVRGKDRRLLSLLDVFHPYMAVPKAFEPKSDGLDMVSPPIESFFETAILRWCADNKDVACTPLHDWKTSIVPPVRRSAPPPKFE